MLKLWWIERNGKLATFGREISEDHFQTIYESGPPNPFTTRRDASKHCIKGERPVKIKLVKV
jgi:hypothetical protein